MSLRVGGLPEIPVETVRVARAVFPEGTLAMRVRDRLAELFTDEPFVTGYGSRGRPGLSPGALSLVTVLQFAENLTDRQAAVMAARAIDWKYALGRELTDPSFDHTTLTRFRDRMVEHGWERLLFDHLLDHCRQAGLVDSGGAQRTDSTQVISAVRELNRLELLGESVRAALEPLATAAPGWLAESFPTVVLGEWAERYGPRVNSWQRPSAKTKRERLGAVFAADAYAICSAAWGGGPRSGCARWSTYSCYARCWCRRPWLMGWTRVSIPSRGGDLSSGQLHGGVGLVVSFVVDRAPVSARAV
ncbi:transposase [Streptomyces violascens]|uniref:transposase n=1 Tax=Streptomyces violascens TaxID=67381 RepID=UPI0036C009CF